MPFAIRFTDRDGVREMKKALRAEHLEYVESNRSRIIVSGGTFPDGDDFPVGGIIILDVDTRAEAVEYIENDPFFVHGIFSEYLVERFVKFIFDGKRAAG
ncbi:MULTISPECIES: YciI family protein [unclassified Streptomyces]|uniref:YciI family protein n=1 Tax=unclassified Streptomyces TaxID=2593676 RepID=UPI0022597AFD|nr:MULTISPECIES: YciI family protein [unclassified Streptomyces]MCX4834312.1 YciI family protein [Streptomyces sp. NBC_01016]